MGKYVKKPSVVIDAEVITETHHIETLEGRLLAEKGNYVVTGAKGEKYPVRKDIFEETYVSAETCFVDICVDFDGVLHSYDSGWIDADVIPDPPVEGAIETLYAWLDAGLSLAIFSARSSQPGGIEAMKTWLVEHESAYLDAKKVEMQDRLINLTDRIEFPYFKPAANIYLDDRGVRFDGVFPTADELRSQFGVWYDKKE